MSFFQRVYARTFRWVAGTGVVLTFGLQSLPHLFPQKMMKIAHGMRSEDSTIINEKYKTLLHETCKLMNVDPECVNLTHSSGFSTVSAGILSFPNQSVIALPRNSKYEKTEDLFHAGIVFSQKPIDWQSNVGKALQKVLILTENDIRFLMGHELTHIKNKDFLLSACHSSFVIGVFYTLGDFLPKLLRQKVFSRVVLLNWTVWLSGLPFYYFTRRYMSHQLELIADETSARLGSSYCDGALHYTRNRLKLNRILRSMHGVTGDDLFSKAGNNLTDTFTHPPRTERLRRIKNISKEIGIPVQAELI